MRPDLLKRDLSGALPLNPARTISDIDRVQDGILLAEKSASSATNPGAWISKHIYAKFSQNLEARQYMSGYEDAPIGFDCTSPMDPAFRTQVETAINGLRGANPGVNIFSRFAE